MRQPGSRDYRTLLCSKGARARARGARARGALQQRGRCSASCRCSCQSGRRVGKLSATARGCCPVASQYRTCPPHPLLGLAPFLLFPSILHITPRRGPKGHYGRVRQPREGKRENERSYNNKGQGNKGRKKIQCTSDEQGILSLSLSLSQTRRAGGRGAPGRLRAGARPRGWVGGRGPHQLGRLPQVPRAPDRAEALKTRLSVVHRQKRDIPFALRAAGAPRVTRDYWLRPWPGPTRPNTTFAPTLDLGPDPLAPGPVGRDHPNPKIPDHPAPRSQITPRSQPQTPSHLT